MLSYPERAAQVMEHLCTHDGYPGHGYSQYSREGDEGTETIALSDGSEVAIATGDRDCSSAVCDAWETALPGSTGGATYTGNMRRGFTESGCFEWHPWGDGYQPKRGDVALNETRHTEMYLGGGKMGGFNISETGGIDGAEGDQTGRESRIKDAYVYSHGWDGVLAYVGPEPEEDDEEEEDMTEIIINVPKSDDMAANVMVYVCGDRVHDIANPEALEYLKKVYREAHGGREIPTMELSGARSKPEFQRFLQAIRGGVPSAEIFPAVDMLAARSSERADGNDGTE